MKWNGPYGMNNTDRPAEPGFFFEGTGEELYEQLHHNWQRAMQPTPRVHDERNERFVSTSVRITPDDEGQYIEIDDGRNVWVVLGSGPSEDLTKSTSDYSRYIDITPFAPRPRRRRWRRLMHILFGDEIIDDPRY